MSPVRGAIELLRSYEEHGELDLDIFGTYFASSPGAVIGHPADISWGANRFEDEINPAITFVVSEELGDASSQQFDCALRLAEDSLTLF